MWKDEVDGRELPFSSTKYSFVFRFRVRRGFMSSGSEQVSPLSWTSASVSIIT